MYIVTSCRTFLKKNPFFINVGVYGTLFASAEFFNQTLNKKILPASQNQTSKKTESENFNWASVARYAVYGTAVLGPSLFVWYKFLDRVFPGKAAKTIVKKVLTDQFCFGFPCLGVFFTVMNVLEGKEHPFEGVPEKWKQSFVMGCGYWMPVQAINFFVMPAQYRVVYVGVMSFIWSNFLIYLRQT